MLLDFFTLGKNFQVGNTFFPFLRFSDLLKALETWKGAHHDVNKVTSY